MLARDNKWIFELGWSFDFLVGIGKGDFGVVDFFVFVAHAMLDFVEVGLDPNEDRAIAGFFEHGADFVALFFGIKGALDNESLLAFRICAIRFRATLREILCSSRNSDRFRNGALKRALN